MTSTQTTSPSRNPQRDVLKNILLEAQAKKAVAEARLADSDAALRETGLVIAQAEVDRQEFLNKEAQADATAAELRVLLIQESLTQEKYATDNTRIHSENLLRQEQDILNS